MKHYLRNFHEDAEAREIALCFIKWAMTDPYIRRLLGDRGLRVAAWHKHGRVRGFYVYPVGSPLIIARADIRMNRVHFYYRGEPVELTRLSYLIGPYDRQEEEELWI